MNSLSGVLAMVSGEALQWKAGDCRSPEEGVLQRGETAYALP